MGKITYGTPEVKDLNTSKVVINNKEFILATAQGKTVSADLLDYYYFSNDKVYMFTLWKSGDTKVDDQNYNDLQTILKTFTVK